MSNLYVINGVWSTMLRDPFISLNVEMYRKCAALGCRASTSVARDHLRSAVLHSRYSTEVRGFLKYVDMLLSAEE
jgi:hypothetical protein